MERFQSIAFGMRPLCSVVLLLCLFVVACLNNADALDCNTVHWWNFDRIDGDLQQRRSDAEARAALANMKPIVFRGRIARVRELSNMGKTTPIYLMVFRDVEILRGALPRSTHDGKMYLVSYEWCDGTCVPPSRLLRRELTTFIARPFGGGPVTDQKKVVYTGRVDAEVDLCDQMYLTPLQERLLKAPADEIARLIREYPYHPSRENRPAGFD
jgi:hypothetical protein